MTSLPSEPASKLPSKPSRDLAYGPDLHCAYRNGSDRIVILVCRDCHGFELQRLIFPFELLSFACPPAAEVWVFADEGAGVALREHCAASELQIRGAQPIVQPRLDSSMRGQLDALRLRHKAAPTPETRYKLALQEQHLRQWLPGTVTIA